MREFWWRDGLCAQIGSDLFFGGKGQSVREAERACRMCPVREECLTDALTSDLAYGIFGGFTPPVREALARQVNAGYDANEVAHRAITNDRSLRG